MNDIDFEWSIDLDRNRASDGVHLRREFNENFRDHPCSVLEVLVALAIRMDDEYVGNPADPRPDILFWDMILNLDLDWCVDGNFDEEQVREVIQRWMDRRFLPDGTWSIFPIRDPKTDQRSIEIWRQMLSYITENY